MKSDLALLKKIRSQLIYPETIEFKIISEKEFKKFCIKSKRIKDNKIKCVLVLNEN